MGTVWLGHWTVAEEAIVESLDDYVGYTTLSPTYAVIDHLDDVFGLADDDPDNS